MSVMSGSPVGIRVTCHAGYSSFPVDHFQAGLDPERVGDVEEQASLVTDPIEIRDSMTSASSSSTYN